MYGWLRHLGAQTVPHPGGTLYEHLCRVHDRLAVLGSGPDVALAGLTHAVYGTDGFDVVLLDRAERQTLRDLIGGPAEALVYLYGACDRGRTWSRLADGRVVDRFTGQVHEPGREQLRSLLDLTVVNELDVVEHDPVIADRYGAYLRTLFGSWSGVTAGWPLGGLMPACGRAGRRRAGSCARGDRRPAGTWSLR